MSQTVFICGVWCLKKDILYWVLSETGYFVSGFITNMIIGVGLCPDQDIMCWLVSQAGNFGLSGIIHRIFIVRWCLQKEKFCAAGLMFGLIGFKSRF